MQSTRSRFIGVALLVRLFATGMATFLNYYKYKATLGQLVQTRLLVIGYGIENSIQSSLGLGLAFDDLNTLPAMMAREKQSDRLITGIDVFETGGKVLYSTDPARVGKPAAREWISAAGSVKGREWSLAEPTELVAGIALKNNFDLTVGYLAMRYTRDYVDQNVGEMAKRLILIGAIVFACALAAAAGILSFLLRRYERDMKAIEDRIAGTGDGAAIPEAFAPAVEELRGAIADADAGLARVRASLAAAR